LPGDTDATAITLLLTQDSTGSRTVTWPGDIAWQSGGGAPILSVSASTTDMVTLMYVESRQLWYGAASLEFEAPAAVFDTLVADNVDAFIASSTDASSYVSAASINGGTQGMIVVAVAATRDNAAPLTPAISGGGMTTWTQLDESRIFDTGGATQRTLSVFAARQIAPGAASPITVTFRDSSSVLVTHSGCSMLAVVLPNMTATTGLTLAATKAVGDSANAVTGGTGGSSTAPALTFAAAENASNRQLVFLALNATSPIDTTDWSALSSPNPADHTSPTVSLRAFTKASFDTTFTDTLDVSSVFAMVGVELEQG
jgi:hypothetical protein